MSESVEAGAAAEAEGEGTPSPEASLPESKES
jgi:hypothetical protein